MLYSKNGSIPKTETDGTEGWIEIEDAPIPGLNQEVVWWYPPGWVIRPVRPVKEGFIYNWSQSEEKWIESIAPSVGEVSPTIQVDLSDSLDSSSDMINMGSAADIIIMASSQPE